MEVWTSLMHLGLDEIQGAMAAHNAHKMVITLIIQDIGNILDRLNFGGRYTKVLERFDKSKIDNFNKAVKNVIQILTNYYYFIGSQHSVFDWRANFFPELSPNLTVSL